MLINSICMYVCMYRLKTQQKRVVLVPLVGHGDHNLINDLHHAGSMTVNRVQKGELPPSDTWAWRKYGQKPIKGSPYPRYNNPIHSSIMNHT